ncbi:MAG: hypothetical protein HQM09_23130 [Candidatus Riflebacteria bacterium]|nr:hypothetical protein [Candidatus Riflebacteria bacterium]
MNAALTTNQFGFESKFFNSALGFSFHKTNDYWFPFFMNVSEDGRADNIEFGEAPQKFGEKSSIS